LVCGRVAVCCEYAV